MPEIVLLDQQTIDQIAAGEVIERPASVVKELVENAIDAKATAITVEIKDGGKSLIRITDNGCGMQKDQVKLAFLRHSTSKIRHVEDLMTVSSLGFRGEALSSIASVAQVELITKTLTAVSGVRYVIEGGKDREPEEIGAPDGTTFLVRNLFFNTPVRQKFLKTPATEAGYISAMMEHLALSHADISFKFIANGQVKLQTSGNGKLKDIIYQIYGREIAANLIPVSFESERFSYHGFIGKPLVSRGNRNFENYYINQRYIRSKLIAKGIEEAYKPFLMMHQYPFTLLYFELDGTLVDVNVHPTKMELRFQEPEKIYNAIVQGLREALTHKDLIPEVSAGPVEKGKKAAAPKQEAIPEPFEKKRREEIFEQKNQAEAPPQPKEPKRPDFFARETDHSSAKLQLEQENPAGAEKQQINRQLNQPAVPNSVAEAQMEQPKADPLPSMTKLQKTSVSSENTKTDANEGQKEAAPQRNATIDPETVFVQKTPKPEQIAIAEDILYGENPTPKKRNAYRIIGQYLDTYWLVEFEEKLFIIDQHAAHEKVLYEKIMHSLETHEFTSQNLCPPLVVTLSMEEEVLLNQYLSEFEKIGFEIAPFGGREYAISAVPDNLFGLDSKQLLFDMLDGLSDVNGNSTPDVIRHKAATMACKAAVKGTEHLSRPEAEVLIEELLQLENPYNCPHGRPTIISMTKYELERKFKRIV
ncbi:MAG: DNA mismatch repair endonuclease MutL [Lachnospiraceae bacterium]